MDRDELDVLADRVFEALEDFTAGELRALASGLRMAEPRLDGFAVPISHLATNRENGDDPDGLVRLGMRSTLKRASWAPLPEAILYAEDPLWVAIREAVEAIVEEPLKA